MLCCALGGWECREILKLFLTKYMEMEEEGEVKAGVGFFNVTIFEFLY